MNIVSIDFSKYSGKVKPMHAVNNGPLEETEEQLRSNFEDFMAARIPYVRNHDASFNAEYGGEHTVDVHAIFPDFSKDENDPASYDFVLTDLYLKNILAAGSQVFYRLGTKIEHWCKKYGTVVPADFQKWAAICEHIIRHYNEGWADGFHWNIVYWEIWNEADGVKASGDQPNWTGTPEEYYEMYTVAATHLKKCFPELKIGGPAMSYVGNEKWLDGFFSYLTKDGGQVPLDFFSWHMYTTDPGAIVHDAVVVQKKLQKYGYTEAENILNEINYIENWTDGFVSSIEAIIGMRGAAFTAALMCQAQDSPIDMMMYYDARPSVFNGLFDFYTCRKLKGYYPFWMFSKLYELKQAAECGTDDQDLYAAAAADEARCAAMVVYYDSRKCGQKKEVCIRAEGIEKNSMLTCYLLDAAHTMERIELQLTDGSAQIILEPDSVLMIDG